MVKNQNWNLLLYIQLSCSNYKTWFGSPHGTFQFSKPTSWPSSMQKSKTLRYRGAAQIINSFISFSQENAPQLFQYLWSHEAKTVVTCLACKCMRYNFEPCRLIIFSKFSSLNLCKMYGHLCEEYWQIDLSFQTLLISRPYYHPQ